MSHLSGGSANIIHTLIIVFWKKVIRENEESAYQDKIMRIHNQIWEMFLTILEKVIWNLMSF